MKIALLADIHANLQALEACLTDAQSQGTTQLAFLGDLVGYGGQPCAVLDRIMALVAEGAWAIKGNHDDYAVFPPIAEGRVVGEMGASWTHAQLGESSLQFLRNLPLTHQSDNLLLVHASAHEPSTWGYVHNEMLAERSLNAALAQSDQLRYVFGGHVHQQTLYYRGNAGRMMPFKPVAGVAIPVPAHRHWVATVGSVGQPRDGRTEAMYALLERGSTSNPAAARLTFRRVAYNHVQAADYIRQSGMPTWFAERLLLGQ